MEIVNLLLSQIEHLEWAIRPASQRSPGQLQKAAVKSEGEAAARIGELTRMLHPQGAEPPSPAAPVRVARRRRRKAKARTRGVRGQGSPKR